MEVKNPRRILAVSSEAAELHLVRVIKDLTGSAPEKTSTSLAGSSHTLSLKTTYYTSEITIWLDLISSPEEWSASFLSAEAKEVLAVLGGLILVFQIPTSEESDEWQQARDLIDHVGKVVKKGLGGWAWDGVGLCLGIGEMDDVCDWEDYCSVWGLEFVQVRSSSTPVRNEYGEKTGIPRTLEALESNDWASAPAEELGFDLERDLEGSSDSEDSESDNAEPRARGNTNINFDSDPEISIPRPWEYNIALLDERRYLPGFVRTAPRTSIGDEWNAEWSTVNRGFHHADVVGYDSEEFDNFPSRTGRRLSPSSSSAFSFSSSDAPDPAPAPTTATVPSTSAATTTDSASQKDAAAADVVGNTTPSNANGKDESINAKPSTAGGKNHGGGNAAAYDEEEEDDIPLDDNEIRKIELMMTKLQAVRDTTVGLPEEQRKRAAARAVAEVMREL